MGARIIVRGHRLQGDAPAGQLLRPLLTKAMDAFSEELAKVVGEHVQKLISEGRWNERPGKRFGYYRTLKYNLGGIRRPAGSHKEARLGLRRPNMRTVSEVDTRTAQLERHKFAFLVRAMEKAAKRTSGDNMSMGRSNQRFNQALNEVGLYDVTSAVKQARQITSEFSQTFFQEDSSYQQARQKYQKGVQDFLYGSNDHNRFFRETRLGQRYMRWAEAAAQRSHTVAPTFNPNSTGGSRRIRDEQLLMGQRQAHAFAERAKRAGGVRRARSAKSTSPPVTGRFPWGHQTGTLANAWARAEPTIKALKNSYRIVIAPDNRRTGRRPGAGDLTNYLKRTIQRLGGDPLLMKGNAPQELARKALDQTKSRWSAMHIRLKR